MRKTEPVDRLAPGRSVEKHIRPVGGESADHRVDLDSVGVDSVAETVGPERVEVLMRPDLLDWRDPEVW
jgi:hypothetical protein